MINIISYVTPQHFLDETRTLLEQNELTNNLVLGLCNNFADKTKVQEGCVFINAVEGGRIRATSIKTVAKAIVSATTENPDHIQALADYYRNEDIALKGAFGESRCAQLFANSFSKKQTRERVLIAHELRTVNKLPSTAGGLQKAVTADTDVILKWLLEFQEEVKAYPKLSREEMQTSTKLRIEKGAIYKWMVAGEMVSILAVVRTTTHMAILGLVYTPGPYRGKGYATSSVLQLSEQLLRQGFSGCGLFTEKNNPISNHMYRKIGYVPSTQFSDIEFE